MANEKIDWHALEAVMEEILYMHKKALLVLGRRIIPSLTSEDVLQPNDYPELNNHPEFRYEEGLLAGIQTVQIALKALKCDELAGEMRRCRVSEVVSQKL